MFHIEHLLMCGLAVTVTSEQEPLSRWVYFVRNRIEGLPQQ
jgi:hypothetical protein